MYLVMLAACVAVGKPYFGSLIIWKPLSVNIAAAVTVALAIGLQLKNGRFDFSGGGIMLLSAILSGKIAQLYFGSNALVFCALCVVSCTVLSIAVSLMYVYGRNPLMIVTISMALLYEALTCVVWNGGGVRLVSDIKIKALSTFPYALIPMVLAILTYFYYIRFTVWGKQSEILSHNQQSAVNIGVNEIKNVIVSYLFSGILFGFATIIFASTAIRSGAFTQFSTVGQLFTNILPVFIGLMLARYCGDTLGIIFGAVTLCVMSYGLQILFSAELGSAISAFCTGLFIFGIFVFDSQSAKRAARKQRRAITNSEGAVHD
jgi:ribose transport system permease protein